MFTTILLKEASLKLLCGDDIMKNKILLESDSTAAYTQLVQSPILDETKQKNKNYSNI